MLDPDVLLGVRVGPARNIASRKNAGNAGFEMRIHNDAAVKHETSLFGQGQSRAHPNAYNHHVGLQHAAALERRALAVDRDYGIAEMEDDAVLFVQCAYEIAHVSPKHALHRPLLRRHHVDLDIARAQCRRGLEADKAGADHDRAARAAHSSNDRSTIRKRAQRMDMGLIGARDQQPHRLRTRRQQETFVGNGLATGDDDVARFGIDRGDIAFEPKVDAGIRVKAVRTVAATNLPARCRKDSPLTDLADRPEVRYRC